LHIKLDELIRATEGAHNALLDLEELTQDELDVFRQRYMAIAQRAREGRSQGERDTGTPEP
jgi:low affinity Fe/Cu permease